MHRGQIVGPLTDKSKGLLQPIVTKGTGMKKAVLLLHGFSSSPAVFRQIIPALTMYDAVVCPALPGHGDCIEAFSNATAQQWLTYTEELCKELTETYKMVDVIGLSLGGLLACYLTNRYPINHLFLLAPALSLNLNLPLALKATRLLHRLGLRNIPNRAGNIKTKGEAELTYRQLPLKTVMEILTLIQTFQWTAPACKVDVFLGRHDQVVNSKKIASRFEALPNAQIHWLEHSAHVLPLDGDVEEIIQCIKEINQC